MDDSQLFHGWEQHALLLTDNVISDLLCDGDGLHRVWRDVLGEDVDSIFFDAWKYKQCVIRILTDIFLGSKLLWSYFRESKKNIWENLKLVHALYK